MPTTPWFLRKRRTLKPIDLAYLAMHDGDPKPCPDCHMDGLCPNGQCERQATIDNAMEVEYASRLQGEPRG